MTPIAWLIAAYLLGALPSSLLAGRARGIDLRLHGSGNLGATNAFRVLGPGLAVPVVAFDILKGWVPAALFPVWDGAAAPGWALAYGAAAVLGHTFSPFVRFRGGKGVATGTGVFLALAPWAVFAAFIAFTTVVVLTRIVSLGSLVAALILPIAVYVTAGTGPVLWLAIGLTAFVFITHRANIRRLIHRQEHRLGRRAEERP